MDQALVLVLEEVQRREQSRTWRRRLRDNSNPFELPENTFRQLYRLPRDLGFILFNEIEVHLAPKRRRTKIPFVIKFVTAMHFFAHGSYQKSVGVDYHIALSQASVSRCISEVTNVINQHLANVYIKFPRTLANITSVKQGFFEKFQFPGIVGCIDGTHIAIVPPPTNDENYPGNVFINRKSFHSINCQIICDSDLKILNINARYPGSVHDSAIWMMSDINTFLRNNNNRTTWLLGDSGYPLQPFLMTPILRANPNTPEGRYNTQHIQVRNCVERCIGVLKAYFRCLRKDRVLHYSPNVASKIIYACATIYNVLRSRNWQFEDADIEEEDEYNEDFNNAHNVDLLNEGRNIRNNLIAQHFA